MAIWRWHDRDNPRFIKKFICAHLSTAQLLPAIFACSIDIIVISLCGCDMDKLASLVAIYNHEGGIHLWWRFITNLRGYKSHIEHTDASLSHNNFTFYLRKT